MGGLGGLGELLGAVGLVAPGSGGQPTRGLTKQPLSEILGLQVTSF